MIRPHFHNATISIYDPGYRLQSYSMIFRVTFCADEIPARVFLYLSGIVILDRYFQFVFGRFSLIYIESSGNAPVCLKFGISEIILFC